MKIIKSNTSRGAYLALSKQLSTTLNGRNIVIAPDRFAVSVTRAIMETLKLTTMTNVEVIPFSKLGEKFIPNEIRNCLSPNGAVMLLSKVLINLSSRNELCHYHNVFSKDGFSSELYAAITSLRNSGINPEDIKNSIDKMPDNFKAKATDISKIYNEYIAELVKDHEDSTSILEKLETYFKNDRSQISGINFYVTDVYEFTKKEFDILHVIANYALSLTIAIPYGYDYPNNYIYPNYLLSKLSGLMDEGSPQIIEAVDELNEQKDVISKYLFSYKYPRIKKDADKIIIRHAKDKYDEVLQLALDIVKGVKAGKRYRDYEIYVGNLDEYGAELKSVFSRYHIPFFIDKKALLIEQAKSRYILSAIKCVKNDFARQDVLDFVKNPLFYEEDNDISINDIYEFENYVLEYNIDYSIFKKKFDLIDPTKKVKKIRSNRSNAIININDNEIVLEENIIPNIVREKLLYKLKPLTTLDLKDCNMSEYAKACRTILDSADKSWHKHVNDLEKLSAYYLKCSEQVDGKIDEILKEIEDVLSINKSINDFYSIFKSMVENQEIALVPTYLDSVFVGGLESRFMGEHNIYILGATNNEIPCVPNGGSILSRKDKEALFDRAAIEIIPSERQQLYSNMYKVCDIMKKPADLLVISYPENSSSSQTKPSTIVTDLLRYFDNLEVEEIDFMHIMDDPEYIEEAKNIFATKEACYHEVIRNKLSNVAIGKEEILYNSAFEIIKEKKDSLKDLFIDPVSIDLKESKVFTDTTSASRIETFYKCPYQYYLKYILNIKERLEEKFQGTENGIIIHKILEEFMNDIKNGEDMTTVSIKDKVYKYFDMAIEENKFERFMIKPETKRVLLRVREEGVKLCKKVLDILQRSKFRPIFLEGKIGDKDAEIAPLTLNCDKTSVKLNGFIDRVDGFNDDFYIIDYKTYKSAELSLSDLYEGIKVQPFLYMRAVENDKKLNPVGVFYLPIYATFSDENENILQLNGLASNDRDTLIAMDSKVQEDTSKSFVLIKTKKNELDSNKHLDRKHFDILGDYAIGITELAVKNISEGYIKPTPLKGKACTNCSFYNICEFKNKNERKTKNVSMSVFEKEEQDDSNK